MFMKPLCVVVDGDTGARNFAGGPRVMVDCVMGHRVTGARVAVSIVLWVVG